MVLNGVVEGFEFFSFTLCANTSILIHTLSLIGIVAMRSNLNERSRRRSIIGIENYAVDRRKWLSGLHRRRIIFFGIENAKTQTRSCALEVLSRGAATESFG